MGTSCGEAAPSVPPGRLSWAGVSARWGALGPLSARPGLGSLLRAPSSSSTHFEEGSSGEGAGKLGVPVGGALALDGPQEGGELLGSFLRITPSSLPVPRPAWQCCLLFA